MRNQYKILAEKYSNITENDTRVGLHALLKTLQILKVIRWIGDVPEDVPNTLNATLEAWANNCASTIEYNLADFHNVNYVAGDYEADEDEVAEETVEYMIKEVKLTYQKHSSKITVIAPDIAKEDVLNTIEDWARTYF